MQAVYPRPLRLLCVKFARVVNPELPMPLDLRFLSTAARGCDMSHHHSEFASRLVTQHSVKSLCVNVAAAIDIHTVWFYEVMSAMPQH